MSRWPYAIDPDDVPKGAVFDRPELELILNLRESDREYAHARHVFIQKLEKEFWRRDKKYTVRLKGESVIVLDDVEAGHYNDREFQLRERGMFKANRHMKAVDVSNFDAEQRAAHDLTLRRQGRKLAALVAVRRTPTAEPVRRKAPVLTEIGS